VPARGSFQKHQKEVARKEKRQQKLDRRQGKLTPGQRPDSDQDQEEVIEQPDAAATGEENKPEEAE
jgi:hypothetical protein